MRVFLTVLMMIYVVACGGNSPDKREKPQIATTPQPINPAPLPTSKPVVLDSTPPQILAVRQEGLEKIVVEFSEPIRRIDYLSTEQVFSPETWSEDRKILYVPFDVKQIKNASQATLTIRGIVDDANNRDNQTVTIPVDYLPPVIEGIKVIDSSQLLVTFNEPVQFADHSSFKVDGRLPGTRVNEALPAHQAMIRFSDMNLSSTGSHLLTVTRLSDRYGNEAAKRSHGFAPSADKEAPRIVSIKQIPSKRNGRMAFLGFEFEFSEYVVDSRDSDGGLAGELESLLDSMKAFTINGKETINILGKWIPRADHRGGTLYWPSLSIEASFDNNKENTIGLTLTDALGNSQLAQATLVVDSEAPFVQGNHLENEQCEMSGLQAFRCRISEPDVKTAVLQPEATWPASDYTVSVSSETVQNKEQHWLIFQFQAPVRESTIDNILITDKMGNTNQDLIPHRIRYDPTSARPEIIKATAFNNHVLELEFSADVGSIEGVHVDGLPRDFEMTTVDNFQSRYKPANVLLHFSDPVPDGIHRIEINGAARIRNKAARSEALVLDSLDNRHIDIIQSSITQDPDLWDTTDLRFEVTRPLSGSLLAFAKLESAERVSTLMPFLDFTLTPEGMTQRGTYTFRMHKETKEGLQPLSYTQGIVLKVPGRSETQTVYTTWSTEEPRFYLLGPVKPDSIVVHNLTQLDLDSLLVEIVRGTNVITVEKAWISSYISDNRRDIGFKITLPDTIRLQKGPFYKLRVKAARTINFNIELTKPFEGRLNVE